MSRFIVYRVATSILLLVATSVFVFVALRLLPGDPALTRLGEQTGADAAAIERIRREMGLDRSVVEQYVSWIAGVARGDLGTSYFGGHSVAGLIADRIGPTVELTAIAVALAVAIAVPTAVLAALRPGGVVDRAVSAATSLGLAVPQFLVGIVLILIFSVELRWLPARGFVPFLESPTDNLRRMVLPALTLALVVAPAVTRFLRASMLDALQASYVRTAEGKGVPRRRVVTGHVLANALIPAVTVVGITVGHALGGVVIVEFVFGVPGLGSLAVESLGSRDYIVLQGVVLLISAMFIVTTCVIDVLYGVLDPRLRVGAGR